MRLEERSEMTADFHGLLSTLKAHEVAFVVIGGTALVLHGSARSTQDLDICYDRERSNLLRLAEAIAPLHPRLRDAPVELPFRLDEAALRSGLNFKLTTDLGDLDLLGEVAGIGGYSVLHATATVLPLYGVTVEVMDLDSLERAKAAAGRLKDVLDIAEIRLLRARQPN